MTTTAYQSPESARPGRSASGPVFRALAARWLVLLLVALTLVACDTPPPRSHNYSGATMGTYWTVQLVAGDRGRIDGMQQAIEEALETVNSQMSTYRADAHISQFNRAEAGEAIHVPAEFAEVLEAAMQIAQESDGLFDPTIGPLVNLWGFGPDGSRREPPSEQEIIQALARVGWQRLQWDAQQRRLTQPGGAYLDFSAIAKGYAVDLIAQALEQRHIESYLINIGGDMRASGNRPDGTPWRIGIERPHSASPEVHSVIQIGNAAVVTSGSYRNFFEADGEHFSHTIDPRTGQPVPNDLVSVTVVHDDCTLADAYATAITVMGLEKGLEYANSKDLAVFLLVKEGEALREHMTSAFEPLLQNRSQ